MARLTKYEEGRRDGMDYAYRLAIKEGLEALGRRVDRNRKSFAPAFLKESDLHEFEYRVKHNCTESTICMMAMVLRDKYGFGKKRMAEFVAYFYDMADSIAGEWLCYDDIVQAVLDETGVDLRPHREAAAEIMDITEKELNQRIAERTNGQIQAEKEIENDGR